MDLPRVVRVALLRLRSLAGRSRVEEELDEELRDHLDAAIHELTARGLTPSAARTEALRALGGLEAVKEECRDRRRVGLVENTARDLAYGARILRRTPGFTLVAVLSLALGIGANAAIFQLLDAVRLRALPVAHPFDLAIVEIANRGFPPGGHGGPHSDLTNPHWERIRDRQQVFSGMFVWTRSSFDLSDGGESRFSENGLLVSGAFFDTLGVTPAAGRLLTETDDVRGCADPAVVVSYGFWQRALGGSHAAVGSRIAINGRPLRIVGVAARGFHGVEVGRAFDLAVPLCAEPIVHAGSGRLQARNQWFLAAMGRLKPGVTVEHASAQLAAISSALFAETIPPSYAPEQKQRYHAYQLTARPGASGFSTLREQYDTPLWLLLSLAGVVLLIACANLANLMLARVGARDREIAVRLALGASRGRIVRQLLVESLLLAAVGAAGAAGIAPLLAKSVVAMISTESSPLFLDLALGWRVVAFTAAVAGATTVLFGLAPALRGTRMPIEQAMRAASRSLAAGGARVTLRRALVVAQLALSLVMLAGGLMFARTLHSLSSIDPGFAREGLLQANVDLTRLNLSQEAVRAHRDQILATLRSLPAVRSAAIASTVPLVGAWSERIYVGDAMAEGLVWFNRVTPHYFATLGTPIAAGRDFGPADNISSPAVAVVNEAFVADVLRAEPIGNTFRMEEKGIPDERFHIIGVVRNTKYRSLREEPLPIVYLAQGQAPFASPFIRYFMRLNGSVAPARAMVKAALERHGAPLVFHFEELDEQIGYSIMRERLMAWLSGFFALLAAGLAVVGVYGVIAYSVQQRRGEIAVRIALGATRGAVLQLVMREAAWLLLAGLGIGLALAWSASGLGASLLFGVTTSDPVTYAASAVVLGAAALAATLIPAWRAARSGPLAALRAE
ncbi:MAG: ABC transporter permease [Vicinamibacterales bacterium]